MKKKIESRIEDLTKEIQILQEQRQKLADGINKLQKASREADLAMLANQSKVTELMGLIEEPEEK